VVELESSAETMESSDFSYMSSVYTPVGTVDTIDLGIG
jgi:hypothetical protein